MARASGSCMHTDAIWRACRIILDVRMHRGELSRRRGDRLPRRAHGLRDRQRPRPRSGATPTRPTYQLSYLLGKRADPGPARGRAAPARRSAFSLRDLPRHAAAATGRCRSASIAGCSPGEELTRMDRCIPADRPRAAVGRGSCTGPARRRGSARRPTAPDADRRAVRGAGRADHPPRGLRRRAAGSPGEPRGRRCDRGSRRRARSSSPAGWRRRTMSASRSPPAQHASCCRLPSPSGRTRSGTASRSPATGWPSAWIRDPSAWRRFPWHRPVVPTIEALVGGAGRAGRPPSRAQPRRHDTRSRAPRIARPPARRGHPRRRRRGGPRRRAPGPRCGRRRTHPRRGAALRSHRLPTRPGGRRMIPRRLVTRGLAALAIPLLVAACSSSGLACRPSRR